MRPVHEDVARAFFTLTGNRRHARYSRLAQLHRVAKKHGLVLVLPESIQSARKLPHISVESSDDKAFYWLGFQFWRNGEIGTWSSYYVDDNCCMADGENGNLYRLFALYGSVRLGCDELCCPVVSGTVTTDGRVSGSEDEAALQWVMHPYHGPIEGIC